MAPITRSRRLAVPALALWTAVSLAAAQSQSPDEIVRGLAAAVEFDDAVAQLRASIPTSTDPQVALAIMRLLQRIGDGHTGAFAESGPAAMPLLTFDFADGQYVIAAARSYAQLLGARVTAVGGAPIQQVVERIAPIVSRDHPTWIQPARQTRPRAGCRADISCS